MDQQISQQSEVDAQKALLDALLGNDFQKFCHLLESGEVDPVYRYGFPHFSTCLEIASRHPELPATFISKLLECGVKPNVNVVVPEPIHYAARCGNAAVLRVLLSHPATRVNAVDSSGLTALHYAVLAFTEDCLPERASDFESCIETLVECSRFDINITDNIGYSALHLAANKKRYRAATAIIEKARAARRDLDVDRHIAGGRTAREALEAELPDMCLRLIAHGNNLPASKKRLLEAVDLGDFSLYQRLLRRAAAKDGFDVDFWFEKPFDTRLLERACGLQDPQLAAKFVRVTLDAGAHPSSVNLCSRSTPLHVATATGNWAALKLLVEHPLVEINVKDGNGQTPLHIAAASCSPSQHAHDCLELLLNAGNIDVNAKDVIGRTPADVAGCNDALIMIKEKGGLESGTTSLIQPFNRMRTLHLIKRSVPLNPDDGTAPADSTVLFDGGGETIWTKPVLEEKKRLFDLMVQRQYIEFEELFEKMSVEENFLKCDECGYTFLQYACERGLHDFAKKLLEKVDPNETTEKNRRTPLILASLQNDSHMVHILLNTTSMKEIDTNATDHKQNTALHYAAKNENMDIIFELLSHGADILAKNMFGKYPLSIEELERLLDKCIEVKDNILPSNDDFAIIFNYKMLISQHTPKLILKDHKSQSNPSQAESTNGKLVLLGPRSHIKYSEMNFLNSLSSSHEYAPLLKHPLITSFLRVKDDCMRPFLSLNLILCIVFVITLNAYIVMEVGKLYENSTLIHSIQMCFCAAAFICTVFMFLRETAQLILKTNLYITNCENLFDLILIYISALILLHCPLGAFTQWAYTIAILLSWRDLFIVTGRHYKFSTNVQMLKAVSLNYLQFLKSYIFIIFAFCLSFYVIFSQSNNQPRTQSSNSQDNNTADVLNQTQTNNGMTEAINFFENPLITLLKTVIMMTGEFESSNLPFLTDIWLTSIVFVLFLFFLHVVLLNLLTALAVSDEQQIRGNAEILSLISQIKLLYEIENIALSLYTLFKHCRCISKHFLNLLLFSEKSLEEACLFTWPNKGTQARLSGEQGDLIKHFDSKIVNEAKCIVTSRGLFSFENGGDTDGLSALMQHIEHLQTNVKLLLQGQQVKSGKNMEQL